MTKERSKARSWPQSSALATRLEELAGTSETWTAGQRSPARKASRSSSNDSKKITSLPSLGKGRPGWYTGHTARIWNSRRLASGGVPPSS